MVEIQSRLAKLYPEYVIAHQPSEAIQGGMQPCNSSSDGDAEEGEAGGRQGPGHAVGAASEREQKPRSPEASRGEGWKPEAQADQGTGRGHHATQAGTCSLRPGEKGEKQEAGEGGSEDKEDEEEEEGHGRPATANMSFDCSCMLANAAMRGDEFAWHQDADPLTFPLGSTFVRKYGQYSNRVGARVHSTSKGARRHAD